MSRADAADWPTPSPAWARWYTVDTDGKAGWWSARPACAGHPAHPRGLWPEEYAFIPKTRGINRWEEAPRQPAGKALMIARFPTTEYAGNWA